MAELIQQVTNGVIENTARSITAQSSNNLDKNAFLKLLCAQLNYQDPLNPQSDTEFVSQLAVYSQLEELQNMSQSSQNQQAISLVGKEVILAVKSEGSGTTYKQGKVDYLTYANGTAKLSVNDKLYDMTDLYSVLDNDYIIGKGLPSIEKEVKEDFDKANPKDITFDVNTGSGDTVATQVAVVLNGSIVDSKYVSLNKGQVTIKADAFKDLKEGVYNPSIIFNDYYTTVSTDKVTITVKDSSEVSDEAVAKLLEDKDKGNTNTEDEAKNV